MAGDPRASWPRGTHKAGLAEGSEPTHVGSGRGSPRGTGLNLQGLPGPQPGLHPHGRPVSPQRPATQMSLWLSFSGQFHGVDRVKWKVTLFPLRSCPSGHWSPGVKLGGSNVGSMAGAAGGCASTRAYGLGGGNASSRDPPRLEIPGLDMDL